jgi:hypothetical protein
MAEEDTEAIVQREVENARRILREDRLLKSHSELRTRFDKQFPEQSDTVPEGDGKPPAPKADPDGPPVPEKKPGIWWGNASE